MSRLDIVMRHLLALYNITSWHLSYNQAVCDCRVPSILTEGGGYRFIYIERHQERAACSFCEIVE